jgi:glycosyltransferase involved in cell wall biosynthesis
VCITNYTRSAVGVLAPKTWVLPNAVDPGFFDVMPAPDGPPPVLVCIGAICLRKNQNAFIRALDPLAAAKEFKLLFVGQPDDGEYGAEFFELLRTRPWCGHVPFSDRDRVREFLRTATAVALPTLEDNCPMVVLEAMAAGVPVLASEVGGVPDLIQPGVTGLFCNPQRPESFRAGVARLLDDPAFARQLAAQARQRARERFHPEVIARGHLEIYREVLGQH